MTGVPVQPGHVRPGDVQPGGVQAGGVQPGQALSGRPVGELTLEAVRRGEVSLPDLRIHPATLEHQAQVAQDFGNPQLAGNLRRAAELTTLGDDEVLAIYEALRPGPVDRGPADHAGRLARRPRPAPLRRPPHRSRRNLRTPRPHRMKVTRVLVSAVLFACLSTQKAPR